MSAMISKLFFKKTKQRAATLVVTLLVLVLISTIVVAFMQSVTLERGSSASLLNRYRAELAAEAGLAEAESFLLRAIGNRREFVVTSLEHSPSHHPVVLIGRKNAKDDENLYPLVSGDLSGFKTEAETHSVDLEAFLQAIQKTESDLTANLNRGKNYEDTDDTTRYRAPWVYIQDDEGNNISRYAFFVFDEQAKLNPFLHQGLASTPQEGDLRKSSQIPLDSEFLPLVSDQNQIDEIKDSKDALLTKQSLALLLGKENYEKNKHKLSVHNAIEEDIIPAGYFQGEEFKPYKDAGKPKYDINALATKSEFGNDATARAENIGRIINENLPDFQNREKSLINSEDDPKKYANRIAASIVDYIDQDTIPTLVNDGELAGKDLTPYVAGFAERNTLTDLKTTPPFSATVKSEFFIQLWNPYTTNVSGSIKVKIFTRQMNMEVGGSEVDFNDWTSPEVAVDLRPNEFKVFELGEVEQLFPGLAIAPVNFKWFQTTSNNIDLRGLPGFEATFNNTVFDRQRRNPPMKDPATAGLVRAENTFDAEEDFVWSFNFTPSNSPNTVGDPRITYLSQTDWDRIVNNALWMGRQADATASSSQNFKKSWENRDYVRQNPSEGKPMGNFSDKPTDVVSQYNETIDSKISPSVISNKSMLTIAEIGHVFDPVQVNNSGNSSSRDRFCRAGGGRTLRIGQAEESFWGEEGLSATRLLDLFTVKPQDDEGNEIPIQGRININTAPKEVLAAAFSGIEIKSDEGIPPSKVDAEKMADAIIANRPYSKVTDLERVYSDFVDGKNFDPEIPNVTVVGIEKMAVMDRAREELFRRTYHLFTTQSRAFSIVVLGQSLNAAGNPISSYLMEGQMTLDTEEFSEDGETKTRFVPRKTKSAIF